MATALVPKIVLTVNHASGAGLLRDGGAGLRSRFHLQLAHWTHGSYGRRFRGAGSLWQRLERLKQSGQEPNAELEMEMQRVRETYERDLDAKFAAARGFVDAVIAPEDTRDAWSLLTSQLELFRSPSGAVCIAGGLA